MGLLSILTGALPQLFPEVRSPPSVGRSRGPAWPVPFPVPLGAVRAHRAAGARGRRSVRQPSVRALSRLSPAPRAGRPAPRRASRQCACPDGLLQLAGLAPLTSLDVDNGCWVTFDQLPAP